MREQAPGANLLHESVSGASSLVCTEICLRAKLGSKSFVVQHTFSLEIVGADEGVLLWELVAGACCGSKLPCCVLRVHWLGYIPRSVFRECVSEASSLVCTGLKEFRHRQIKT